MMAAQDASTSTGDSAGRGASPRPGLLSRLLGRAPAMGSALDTFRRLALQLDQDLSVGARGRVVLLASPDQDGVAELACEHLAAVMAEEMGRRVLTIAAAPSNESGAGLADVLRDGVASFDAAVKRQADPRRATLNAGANLVPALLLGSPHRKAMIEQASASYDFVLIHAAPVLRDSTGLALSPLADCVLLLALEGKTHLEHLDAARKLVASRTQARLGVLLVNPPKSLRGLL